VDDVGELRVALDHEVEQAAVARRRQLGAQAGVARPQVFRLKLRQQLLRAGAKGFAGLEVALVVVLVVYVSRVGAEEQAAPERFGQVDTEAEAGRVRRGVDEPVHPASLFPGDFPVFAAARVDCVSAVAEERRHLVGEEPGGVDEDARLDFADVGCRGANRIGARRYAFEARIRSDVGTALSGERGERLHQRLAFDEAGRRHPERRTAGDVRLALLELLGRNQLQPFDAVLAPTL